MKIYHDIQGMSSFSAYKNKTIVRLAMLAGLVALCLFIWYFAQSDFSWKETSKDSTPSSNIETTHIAKNAY